MSKKHLTLAISVILLLSMLLAACGGAAEPTPRRHAPAAGETPAAPAPAAAEPVTLRLLVHQNPPMVEFMQSFNDKFTAKQSQHQGGYGGGQCQRAGHCHPDPPDCQ